MAGTSAWCRACAADWQSRKRAPSLARWRSSRGCRACPADRGGPAACLEPGCSVDGAVLLVALRSGGRTVLVSVALHADLVLAGGQAGGAARVAHALNALVILVADRSGHRAI